MACRSWRRQPAASSGSRTRTGSLPLRAQTRRRIAPPGHRRRGLRQSATTCDGATDSRGSQRPSPIQRRTRRWPTHAAVIFRLGVLEHHPHLQPGDWRSERSLQSSDAQAPYIVVFIAESQRARTNSDALHPLILRRSASVGASSGAPCSLNSDLRGLAAGLVGVVGCARLGELRRSARTRACCVTRHACLAQFSSARARQRIRKVAARTIGLVEVARPSLHARVRVDVLSVSACP